MADQTASRSEPSPSNPLGQVTVRRTIGTLIVAALLGAGVWLMIGQVASYSRLLEAVHRAVPVWLAVSLAGVIAIYAGYALLYQTIAQARGGPCVGLPVALRVTVAVFGMSIVATTAGRLGGEYWTLRRLGERAPEAGSRVLALNTGEWVVLAGIAALGALALLAGLGHPAPLGVELVWILIIPACAIPARFLTSGTRLRLAEDRGGRLRRTFASALRAIVLLRVIAGDRSRLVRALAGGLIYWGGDFIVVWAALRAFGAHIGPAPLAVAFATGYAATTLPLPAGGAGGVEAASTYALTLVGVPLGPALLGSLVYRVATYWLPLALAVVSARSIKRLGGDLEALRGATREQPERREACAGRALTLRASV